VQCSLHQHLFLDYLTVSVVFLHVPGVTDNVKGPNKDDDDAAPSSKDGPMIPTKTLTAWQASATNSHAIQILT
jgi:hypothetical protein